MNFKAVFKPPQKHPELIVDMARLSRMAYSSPEYVDNMWKIAHKKQRIGVVEPDLETIQVLKRVVSTPIFCNSKIGDSQSYAVYYQHQYSRKLVLVARGTSSLKDAVCDAKLNLAHCNEFGTVQNLIKVHSGFYEQFRALQPCFDSHVDPYMTDHKNQLICCGHSLGAGLCTIASLVYAIQYPKRVSYYGFGSPRVGNKEFSDLFDKHVLEAQRYKNSCDPVSKIPLAIGYHHIGFENDIGKHDDHPNIPLIKDIPDHDILKYVNNLKKLKIV